MKPGERIGAYRITDILGRGGMGEVYAAVHERMNQPVAIKLLTRLDPACLARFLREARALSQLSHPGIVRVLYLGETEAGIPYLVLEQVAGRTLRDHLRAHASGLPRAQALSLLTQLARALSVVHEHHIVHRDIKPENILVTTSADGDDGIKLIDFGIAQVPPPACTGNDTLFETSEHGPRFLGTAAYMAPEQCRGSAPIGAAADVYAMGLVLCEGLTGRLPFVADDPVELAAMHLHSIPSLAALPSASLRRLTRSMLAKDPAQRPSMASVARTLSALAEFDRRRHALALLGGVAAGVGALLLFGGRSRKWPGVTWAPTSGNHKKSAGVAIDDPEKGVLTQQMRPSGLILIAHMELGTVTPAEMLSALPRNHQLLPVHHISVPVTRAASTGDFSTAQALLAAWFHEKLQPLLERYPDYQVVYFGVAPIPLIVYLGWLLGPLRPIEVRLRHHVEKRFLPWAEAPRALSLLAPQWSHPRDEREGEVVVKLSTSHRINEVGAHAVVPAPLCAVDLRLPAPAEDVFDGAAQLSAVATGWKSVVDEITERFPRVRQIHLFASVQAGLALLLGTHLSRAMHPRIQTYQYRAGEYLPALTINPPQLAQIEGTKRNGFSATVRAIPSDHPAY